jgi:Fe2+ or Zn2+ uptake regulation protein
VENVQPDSVLDERLTQKLAQSGFRFTPQRHHVYAVLIQNLDHPTADQVFMRAKQSMPDISMATVYNTLDALVKSGLVRQVNLERAATRYCPNMREHYHFYCDGCGHVHDIDVAPGGQHPDALIPAGFRATHFETSIRGLCPACAAGKPAQG